MPALKETLLQYVHNLLHDRLAVQFEPVDPRGDAESSTGLQWTTNSGLEPGHYRLSLRLQDGVSPLSSERLHVQNLEGDWETTYLQFTTDRSNRAAADFFLPRGATTLKLSPKTPPVSFKSANIRRVGSVERYLMLVKTIGTLALKNRGDIRRLGGYGVSLMRRKGMRGLVAHILYPKGEETPNGYRLWIETYDSLSEDRVAGIRAELADAQIQPRISLLLAICDPDVRHLRSAIESVVTQIYGKWELCIAGIFSSHPEIRQIVDEYAAAHPNVRPVEGEIDDQVFRACNSALRLATGEWAAIIGQNDRLSQNALAEIVLAINRHPSAQLIYSDEDKLTEGGDRRDPHFKPDFSLPLLQSHDFLHRLALHRTENIKSAGAWRPGFEGSENYDLHLRIAEGMDVRDIRHIPKILYHSRESLSASPRLESGLAALREHIGRLRLAAKAEFAEDAPCYRVRFDVPVPQPQVSLIIPTRDQAGLLRNCISSIIEKTEYDNYEIIVVDNGSVEAETLALFRELQDRFGVVVLPYKFPFNYSAINNFGVKSAKGSIIGLINNDIEVISPGWLAEMVSWAIQPDIGCVGAKLYYGNGTIQHGGIILGINGIAGHAHKHFPGQHPGYFNRLKVHQNFSAVTGACLIVRKELFEKVGGLDESHLAVALNDVDFCLRLREVGYGNIWTPYAELYHLESVSRGSENNPQKKKRFEQEREFMLGRWDLENDPYYSPNLSRTSEDFSPRLPEVP
jgi:GT2 family glycosyltransferase